MKNNFGIDNINGVCYDETIRNGNIPKEKYS